ncbi:hypothetical protein JVT61DRAFT_15167 [Boletus reticuloceps]|uniref:Uncharacterized protein n=1 Tax=Boletus reticuloceps TaxID=495285 RepID=A0A8I3A9Z8_9AGAM|nr:hypothetical protein JVT61DRAFT_15167 [Boletus reticuloceps]
MSRSLTHGLLTAIRSPINKAELIEGRSSAPLKFIHFEFKDRKRKRCKDSTDEDLSGSELNLPPSKKANRDATLKAKCRQKRAKEQPRAFTVYLQVWSTGITTVPKRPGRAANMTTTTTSVSKGPFKLDTSCSFSMLQRKVANTLPCHEALLPVSQFEWKFDDEPRGAPRKRIADDVGFEALVAAIKKRGTTRNVIVWLHLPTPTQDEDNRDTGRSDHVEDPLDFDGEREVISNKELIIEKRRAAIIALELEYPVGNTQLFGGKRVWQNRTTGSYFELAPMYMKVWAHAIADLSAPPPIFDEVNRMKAPTSMADTQAPVSPPTADAHLFPGYPQQPPHYPYYPPQYPPYMFLPGYPYACVPPQPPLSGPGNHYATLPPFPGIAGTHYDAQ